MKIINKGEILNNQSNFFENGKLKDKYKKLGYPEPEKLGAKGDILFKYPNFIGTLQHFIDTYLAIPYFKLKYKRKVE